MTSRARRRVLPLLSAVVLAGTLAACNPVRAGSAAVVGHDRIGEDRLATLVHNGLSDSTVLTSDIAKDPRQYQSKMLSYLINRDLVQQLAARLGINVSDEDVNRFIATEARLNGGSSGLAKVLAAQAGIPPSEQHDFLADLATRQAITEHLLGSKLETTPQLRQYYDAHPEQFVRSYHVAHILLKDKATADQVYALAKANPGNFAALADKYSTDPSAKQNHGDLGTQQPGSFVPEFEKAVYSGQDGEILPPVQTQFGWHVIKIISIDRLSFEDVAPILATALYLNQTHAADPIDARLAQESRQVGVHVNPRFGTWNPATLTVAPSADQLSTPAPAGSAGSSGSSGSGGSPVLPSAPSPTG